MTLSTSMLARASFAGAVVLALAACQSAPPPQRMAAAPAMQTPQPPPQQEQMVWVRTDGQRGAGNPALERQYNDDISACLGGGRSAQEGEQCMSQRGYVHVPVSQAEATRLRFAAQSGRG